MGCRRWLGGDRERRRREERHLINLGAEEGKRGMVVALGDGRLPPSNVRLEEGGGSRQGAGQIRVGLTDECKGRMSGISLPSF